MAFDAATGRLLLFGGLVTTGTYHEFDHPLGDMWSWDGAHWSPVQLTSGPVARNDAGMAYDAARRVVMMRGGRDARGAFINDTWLWDGARWLLKSPNQAPPDGGGSQPVCWDSDRDLVLLFDDTGRYRRPIGPPMSTELNQTWAWDGTNWTQLPAAGAPSGHGSQPAGIAYDAARKSTVFFGHVNGIPTTWTFDGTAWTQASTAGSASMNFSLAADVAHSVVVLFGENGDTWTWDGTKWTGQSPTHSPPPRRGASMAYDSLRHVVVLFGGGTGEAAGFHELNDTWTWNGADWTEVVPPGPSSTPSIAPAPPLMPTPS